MKFNSKYFAGTETGFNFAIRIKNEMAMNLFVIKGVRKDKEKSPSVCYYKSNTGTINFVEKLYQAKTFLYRATAELALEHIVSHWRGCEEWDFSVVEVEKVIKEI